MELIAHQSYSESLEKNNSRSHPPTTSEMASFRPPLPSKFPLLSFGGKGGGGYLMDIFWNYTITSDVYCVRSS